MDEKSATFTWTQTAREVEVRACFEVPFKLKSREVVVEIKRQHLTVGLRGAGQPSLIEGATFGKVSVEGSTWTLEKSNTVVITLEKADLSQLWFSLLKSGQCLKGESCDQILTAMPDNILLHIIRKLGVLDQCRLLTVNKRWNAHITSCLRCVTINEVDLKMQMRKYEMKNTPAEFIEGFLKSHGNGIVKLVVLADLVHLGDVWQEWVTRCCGNLEELSLFKLPGVNLGPFATGLIAVSSYILKDLPMLKVLNAELPIQSISECDCLNVRFLNSDANLEVSSLLLGPGTLAILNQNGWLSRLFVEKVFVVEGMATSELQMIAKIRGLRKLYVRAENYASLLSNLAQMPSNMQELELVCLEDYSSYLETNVCFDSVLKNRFSKVESLMIGSWFTISTLESFKALRSFDLKFREGFPIELFKSLPSDIQLDSFRLVDQFRSASLVGNEILKVVANRGFPISVLWLEGCEVKQSVLRSLLGSICPTLKTLVSLHCGLGDQVFKIIRNQCIHTLGRLALEDERMTLGGINRFLIERQAEIARGESLLQLDLIITKIADEVPELACMGVTVFSSLFGVRVYSILDLFGGVSD